MSSDKKRKKKKKRKSESPPAPEIDHRSGKKRKAEHEIEQEAPEKKKKKHKKHKKTPAAEFRVDYYHEPREDHEEESRKSRKKRKKKKKSKERSHETQETERTVEIVKKKKRKHKKKKKQENSELPDSEPVETTTQLSFAIQRPPKRRDLEDSSSDDGEIVDRLIPRNKGSKKGMPEKESTKTSELGAFSVKTEVPAEYWDRLIEMGVPHENIKIFYHVRSLFDDYKGGELPEIHCTAGKGCTFRTAHKPDCLTYHCQVFHDYGTHPCKHKDCHYVGYSKQALNKHSSQFHGTARKKLSKMIKRDEIDQMLCEVESCNGVLRDNTRREYHRRIHSNDLDTCKFCGARYLFKTNRYDHHVLRHLNIQLFECEEAHCDEWFFSADKLTTHNQRFHQKIEYYHCEGCKKAFGTYGDMRIHTVTCVASIKLRNPHLFTGESSQNKAPE